MTSTLTKPISNQRITLVSHTFMKGPRKICLIGRRLQLLGPRAILGDSGAVGDGTKGESIRPMCITVIPLTYPLASTYYAQSFNWYSCFFTRFFKHFYTEQSGFKSQSPICVTFGDKVSEQTVGVMDNLIQVAQDGNTPLPFFLRAFGPPCTTTAFPRPRPASEFPAFSRTSVLGAPPESPRFSLCGLFFFFPRFV